MTLVCGPLVEHEEDYVNNWDLIMRDDDGYIE